MKVDGRFTTLLPVFAILVATGIADRARSADSPTSKFPKATVRFEQNATDGDVEVVFEVTGRSEGMSALQIVAPDGRAVVDFKAPVASTLGIRQFVFESPEPTDVAGLKAAYPAGRYAFTGATASGAKLSGTADLSHELPATTAFVSPKANAQNVATTNQRISWKPVEGIVAYVIELEQADLDVNLTTKLPGSANSFSVPQGFLTPGKEYQLGIGTVSKEGNISFIETSFTTAGAK